MYSSTFSWPTFICVKHNPSSTIPAWDTLTTIKRDVMLYAKPNFVAQNRNDKAQDLCITYYKNGHHYLKKGVKDLRKIRCPQNSLTLHRTHMISFTPHQSLQLTCEPDFLICIMKIQVIVFNSIKIGYINCYWHIIT